MKRPQFIVHIKNNKIEKFTDIPLNNFGADNIHIDNDNYLVVFHGVVLKYPSEYNNKVKFIQLLISTHIDFSIISEIRGTFYGFIFNKKTGDINVFSDHLGTKPLYYSFDENEIIISNNLDTHYKYKKQIDFKNQLNINASYMLLSFGFMLEDECLDLNTKRLRPGETIYYNCISGEKKIKKWYQLPNSSWDGDFDESKALKDINKAFELAIHRAFKKDLELGKKHFVGLSGGLDSRMTAMVAHNIGYTNQLNYTFSQSDYLDESIPKKIASDLKNDWIFKFLDNGVFLKPIEKLVSISGGNNLFFTTSHTYNMFQDINFEDLGIIHSGQLGDIIINSSIENKELLVHGYNKGAYSNNLKNKISNLDDIKSKYSNAEMYIYNTRGLFGANYGLHSYQIFSETYSPFYDIDFFELCLSIPIKYRANNQLYKKWIYKYHPNASNYIWETTKEKINYKPLNFKFKNNVFDLRKIHEAIAFKLGIKKHSINTKNHMNPLDYWYGNNEELRKTWDLYFNENLHLFENFPLLKDDVYSHYHNGNAIEKNQVLTLLAAYKLYFK